MSTNLFFKFIRPHGVPFYYTKACNVSLHSNFFQLMENLLVTSLTSILHISSVLCE